MIDVMYFVWVCEWIGEFKECIEIDVVMVMDLVEELWVCGECYVVVFVDVMVLWVVID